MPRREGADSLLLLRIHVVCLLLLLLRIHVVCLLLLLRIHVVCLLVHLLLLRLLLLRLVLLRLVLVHLLLLLRLVLVRLVLLRLVKGPTQWAGGGQHGPSSQQAKAAQMCPGALARSVAAGQAG